jgi:hypothetical protein
LARIQGFIGKVDTALNPFWKKVAFLGRWKVSLTTTIAVVLVVIALRYYYSFVTGFLVPDEIWYYNAYVLDKLSIGSYRPVFVATFVLFFHGVTDVWTFLFRGAAYSSIWAVGCVVSFFMIFRRLRVPESMSSLLVLSLPLFPVFIVFVPTILTETLGLFMALLGVYFGLRYVQEERVTDNRVIINGFLCGVFFVMASGVRESYVLFATGTLFLFLAVSVKRRFLGGIVGYALPFSLLVWFAQGAFALVVGRLAQFSSGPQASPLLPGADVNVGASLASATPMTVALHPDLPRALAVGLAYGFNPLFALFAVFSAFLVSYDLLRRRSWIAFFLVLNAMWSLGAFVFSAEFILEAMFGALSGWTSAIIRTTHSALPCIVGFPSVYGRLKVKSVAALMFLVLIVGSTQVSSLAGAFQRSLSREPVDRLRFDYRAPYYRLYLLAKDSGKTIVFGGIHMRGIRAYMAMLPNVVLVPVGPRGGGGDWSALEETIFRTWLSNSGQGWDSIYLYDDWVTIKIPSWIDAYPEFYSQILRSKQYPGYTVETLWVDGESYALRMVKSSDASVTLPP